MSHLTRIRQRRKKGRALRVIISIPIIIIFCFIMNNILKTENTTSPKILSMASKTVSPTPTSAPLPTQIAYNTVLLSDKINEILKSAPGNYSIAVENLKTGETYYLNEHRSYQSASLYKLWTMATVFNQIKDGIINKEDILTQDISTLNQKFYISEEDAEETDGEIRLSISEALNKMITVSDNYSALLLTEKIKLSKVASFLSENKLVESSVGTTGKPPITTASDMALFYKKLYLNELNDSQYTSEMISLLKNQQVNRKIPKYLPKNIVIAHKTGELNGFSHDAGIVYTPQGDYILVLLSESDDPKPSEELLANLSKSVFTYMTD